MSSKYVIVEDASGFPSSGVIKITSAKDIAAEQETIYYNIKTGNQFLQIQRGFDESRQKRMANR